jgi:hypothetical protein
VATAREADGAPYWLGDTQFPWCYTIGESTSPACAIGGVITDDGGGRGELYFAGTPPPMVAPQVLTTFPPGTTVTATLGKNTFEGVSFPSAQWIFTTTTCDLNNNPLVYFSSGGPAPNAQSNSGISPYYYNDILFNLRGGFFGFRAIANPAIPAGCTE